MSPSVRNQYRNTMSMNNKKSVEIVEFVHANSKRNGDISIPDGPRIGCVVAKTVRVRRGDGKFGSAISIGWSQVNRKAGDKFNRTEALRIARKRANEVSYMTPPRKARKVYARMVDRAERYFQKLYWA